jgi:hypothetical protein
VERIMNDRFTDLASLGAVIANDEYACVVVAHGETSIILGFGSIA